MDKRMFGEVPEVVHDAVLGALDSIERGEVRCKNSTTGGVDRA